MEIMLLTFRVNYICKFSLNYTANGLNNLMEKYESLILVYFSFLFCKVSHFVHLKLFKADAVSTPTVFFSFYKYSK